MPVEFIGYVGTHEVSESIAPSGPVIDTDYTAPLRWPMRRADSIECSWRTTAPRPMR
jgi:hypothetical protein